MSTLILGHEHYMKPENIRCSPIDPNLWYNKPFTAVSFMCEKDDTDIVYDLYGKKKDNKHWDWNFAEDNSYDTIVDCMGSISWEGLNRGKKYRFQDELLETILRVLKINGKFYSHFGIYTKINETNLEFEPKERAFGSYRYKDF